MSRPRETLSEMVRALLTDGERRAIKDDAEMDDGTKRSLLSRVRRKIERMEADAEDLREHQPAMYHDLHKNVCEPSLDRRITALEHEVDRLKTKLEDTNNE